MSYWEWEAPARPLPCRTTHLCPSSTFSEEQCVIDLSSPPLPQGSFSPGLLLLRAIEDREHLTLENILYCREFKKKEAELIFSPSLLARIWFIKLPWRQLLTGFIFSVSWDCLWSAVAYGWLSGQSQLLSWNPRVMSRKARGVGILGFTPRKMIFLQFFRMQQGIREGYALSFTYIILYKSFLFNTVGAGCLLKGSPWDLAVRIWTMSCCTFKLLSMLLPWFLPWFLLKVTLRTVGCARTSELIMNSPCQGGV